MLAFDLTFVKLKWPPKQGQVQTGMVSNKQIDFDQSISTVELTLVFFVV